MVDFHREGQHLRKQHLLHNHSKQAHTHTQTMIYSYTQKHKIIVMFLSSKKKKKTDTLLFSLCILSLPLACSLSQQISHHCQQLAPCFQCFPLPHFQTMEGSVGDMNILVTYNIYIYEWNTHQYSPVHLQHTTALLLYLIRIFAAFLQLVCYLVEGVVCVVDSGSLNVAHIDWHQDVCASLS